MLSDYTLREKAVNAAHNENPNLDLDALKSKAQDKITQFKSLFGPRKPQADVPTVQPPTTGGTP